MTSAGELAQLVAPALSFDPSFPAGLGAAVLRAAALGVGGVVVAGGPADAVADALSLLYDRSPGPLLVGASVERGAGERFAGLTALPPPAAIASLGDDDVLRHAARLTAREARSVGINWALAPVCDVDGPRGAQRTFGDDAARTAALVAEWVDACQAEGVLACAKHFPGIGVAARATVDETYGRLLVPFRAAIDAGVASVLLSHLPAPALGPSGAPAALAREVVEDLLRDQLGFDGLAVADVRLLARVVPGADPAELAVLALAAGCDFVVTEVPDATARAVAAAVRDGRLDRARIDRSLGRRRRWAEWAAPGGPAAAHGPLESAGWAEGVAERLVHVVRGAARHLGMAADVLVVDEGGLAADPASAAVFLHALRDAGVDARLTAGSDGDARRTLVVALVDGGARARPSPAGADARAAVERAGANAGRAARDLVVVHFAPPRDAAEVPAADVICAWSADAVMQRAAARWLARR